MEQSRREEKFFCELQTVSNLTWWTRHASAGT
jgi:hypothetical protein